MRQTIWGTAFLLLLANTFCLIGCGGSGATLSSIAVTPANPAVLVGATQQFTATGTYSDNTTADITATVTWSSSDTAKATITSAGLATAVAAGSPIITATMGSVSGTTTPSLDVGEDTTIDVHAHASANSPHRGTDTAQDLTDLLAANNISKMINMQPPRAEYADPDTSTADDMAFFSGQGGTYRYMYGGAELQPLLFAAGQTEVITAHSVYPNDTAGEEPITEEQLGELNDIREHPDNYYVSVFQTRAQAAAASGLYDGFGELGVYHMSRRATHPQMIYAADCNWLLWLSDLAAQYNMVLDIHMEETAEKLTELSNLLSHNTTTKIIWDHAGWSNTGGATAAVFSQMLADHPNLYLSLKMREDDDGTLAAGSPTNSDGTIKSEWETLLTTYAGRIMVGTDAKYWTNRGKTMETELDGAYTLLNAMLEQLPSETALKIRYTTAMKLFGLAP